jgi:capsule polysaccharide export protein KpsE/RkpR
MDRSVIPNDAQPAALREADDGSLLEFLLPLAQNWGRLLVLPLLVGVVAVGGSFLIAPTFQASTTLLPPQQPQSLAAGALASIGALTGLPTGASRSPADQYVSLMLSNNSTDRLIDKFKLMQGYGFEERWRTRKELLDSTLIAVGKKDGLITVAVEDEDPKRAAALANQYVDELRRLTSELAVTEAQERRMFFEGQLKSTKDKLAQAQAALQASGFTVESLKAEPKAAAEGYARLRAELTTAEVRLQAARGAFTDTAPELRQLQDTVVALRGQLSRSENARDPSANVSADYVSKYREFKYQETLFELMARQFELARVDESREGALIQVVDVAMPPEKKLRPKRATYGIVATLVAFVLMAGLVIVRARLREAARSDPIAHARWLKFKAALGLRGRA